MNYKCSDCGAEFHSTDQNISQQKFGQCPYCLSENIEEIKEEE